MRILTKNKSTEFGKAVRMLLVELDQPQVWLINQVKERTGLYFDDSYLNRILTGKLATPKMVQAIREILNIQGDA